MWLMLALIIMLIINKFLDIHLDKIEGERYMRECAEKQRRIVEECEERARISREEYEQKLAERRKIAQLDRKMERIQNSCKIKQNYLEMDNDDEDDV